MEDINLEQEFQILMRTVIKQINDKMNRGELTDNEGKQLIKMVETRTREPDLFEDDPTYTDYTYDQGWSSSSC
jgi:hypothetical protein